nr:MAG TPA: hypothetical protein [Caudoviricetes sp.]
MRLPPVRSNPNSFLRQNSQTHLLLFVTGHFCPKNMTDFAPKPPNLAVQIDNGICYNRIVADIG